MTGRVLVLGILCFAACNGFKLSSDELQAKKFLQQANEKLFELFNSNNDMAFAKNSSLEYDEDEENVRYATGLKNIGDEARKFDFENFNDKDLKYAFEKVIHMTDDGIIGPEEYMVVYNAEKDFKNKISSKTLGEYGNTKKKVAVETAYEKVYRTSDNVDELLYYYTESRKVSGGWAQKNLEKLLKGTKDSAKLKGVSPLEFWLKGFNLTDMENLVTEVQPFYAELHAFIRNKLKQKHGESVIQADGLVPDHLMDQIMSQITSNRSIIEDEFPFESLPPFDSIIKDNYDGEQLYKIAENFFVDLGFEKYPTSIWGSRIKLIEDEVTTESNAKEVTENNAEEEQELSQEEHDDDDDDDDDDTCEARLTYSTSKIYLEYCKKMTFDEFLEAYVNMAGIYYAKEMTDLPQYFFKYPKNLDYGIGRAARLSASSFENFKSIGMIPESKFPPEVELNRLFRVAVEYAMQIPYNYVHAKLIADLLEDNINMDGLNERYWELMAKYTGTGPPQGHKVGKNLDMPHYIYDEIVDNIMSSDLEMEVLGYQIFKKLCEISDKYPKEPLHLCNFGGSKEAGNALKKMMRLGSSKPFSEILGTMFQENPTVTSEGLLEYFSPLQKYLVEENKRTNAKPGWKF